MGERAKSGFLKNNERNITFRVDGGNLHQFENADSTSYPWLSRESVTQGNAESKDPWGIPVPFKLEPMAQPEDSSVKPLANRVKMGPSKGFGESNIEHNSRRHAVFVRAIHDWTGYDETYLSFVPGDVIKVINKLESGWWDGILQQTRG